MPRTLTPRLPVRRPQKIIDPTTLSNSYYVRLPKPASFVIQNKHRHPQSEATKNFQKREKDRLRKALDYLTHGKDIFAYSHIRTNQVVYSFSRFLHESEVLSQLIYHGKKTVPAGFRRDMWVPYFSVHFRDPEPGLRIYRLLREFSTRRQLEPPTEMIRNTPETVGHKRPTDPNKAAEWDKKWGRRMGRIMSKKDRARVLMDQKATSVADLAFVLQLQDRNIVGTRLEREEEAALERKVQADKATQEERERLEKLKARLAAKKEKQAQLSNAETRRQRRAIVEGFAHRKRVLKRIRELEWQIGVRTGDRIKIEPRRQIEGHELDREDVVVLWKDVQDKKNAKEWPSHVIHHETVYPRDNHMENQTKREETERLQRFARREAVRLQQAEQQAAKASSNTRGRQRARKG